MKKNNRNKFAKSVVGNHFVSAPVREILGDSSNKVKRIVDTYDNGGRLHIDERKLNMNIYRMCGLSLNSKLPGYSDMEFGEQVSLVDELVSVYFRSSCCNWSFYRGDRNYVYVNMCKSTSELIGEIVNYLQVAKEIIKNKLNIKGVNLADFLWFSIGRSHEEFGELLILPAKSGKKHFFHIAEHLPSTSSVISGAVLAREGYQICKDQKIYKNFISGEYLPIITESDSVESEDMELDVKEKKVKYSISFIRKNGHMDIVPTKNRFVDLEDNYLNRFVDDTFFDLNFIKKEEKKQKAVVDSSGKMALSFSGTVLVGVDMAGYSNLVSKVDNLYELSKFLNQKQSFVKYSAMNTHTLLFGMQTLLTGWLDVAVEIFSEADYYSGEFGGDGLKAVKPYVSPVDLEKEIEFAAEISERFDRYLNELRESDIYSEAKIAAHYIHDVSLARGVKAPFLKVAADYGLMIYNLQFTSTDAYAYYRLNGYEGGKIEELLLKLKHQVLEENVSHHKTAISQNIYDILSGAKGVGLTLTHDDKYGYFAQKKK